MLLICIKKYDPQKTIFLPSLPSVEKAGFAVFLRSMQIIVSTVTLYYMILLLSK